MDTSYPLWMKKLPGIPSCKMTRCHLYPCKDRAQLEASLDAGPQFRRLDWRSLLTHRADQLRIILISKQNYYAAQAAAHLTALDRLAYNPLEFEEDSSDPMDLSRYLTQLDASVLNPAQKDDPAAWPAKPVCLAKLNTPAVLIYGNSPSVITPRILDQISDTVSRDGLTPPTHIFLSLRPDQADPALLNRLQYHYFFRVGLVDTPDLSYLARQLKLLTEELIPTQDNIDWAALVRYVQEICGESFTEQDLASLPALAILNGVSAPASQEDLAVKLFDPSHILSGNTSHS